MDDLASLRALQPEQRLPGSLALVFATIERPIVAQRLIRSVRRRFPSLPVYVADQSRDVAAMACFYEAMEVTLVRMPYDAGVCASRNRLAAAVQEEFFVLCDDDFVLGAATDFADALHILRHHPEIGVVGGKLYDFDRDLGEEYARHWELFLHLDRPNRTLTSVPISQYAPRARQLGRIRFYLCDAVMNFAVMRRSMFDSSPGGVCRVGWDERFKSNGEHEDFYLNLKMNARFRVAYLPTMIAYHHHPRAFATYRRRLRDRPDGWRRFLDKWEIDQHLEIGLGVRSIDNLDAVIPGDAAEARFFLNDDLSLRRSEAAAATLQITEATRLSAVGVLNELGEAKPDQPAVARLLVRTGGGVRPGPDEDVPAGVRARLDVQAAETWPLRYGLETPAETVPAGRPAAVAILYNAVLGQDADFVLWYRALPGASGDAALVRLRWTAQDGRVLLWESRPHRLDLGGAGYWLPLLVDMPVLPHGVRFMRFEVSEDAACGGQCLATGFLFPPACGHQDGVVRRPPPAFDVLAIRPWTLRDAQAVSCPAVKLDRVPCHPDGGRVAACMSTDVPGLLLLDLGTLPAGETVLLADWPDIGALAQASHPGADVQAWPQHIALPCPDAGLAAPRLRSWKPGNGFRTLRVVTGLAAGKATLPAA